MQTDQPAREYKAVSFQLEAADDATGEFFGYAAVFGNVDSGGDIIERGAFTKTLLEDFGRVKILSQHDSHELPIGRPLELREDEKGLFIRGKISDTQKGRDILTLMRDGVLRELSIGYDPVEFEIEADDDKPAEKWIRRLKEIKLWEISVVIWAMNDRALINSVKAQTDSAGAAVDAVLAAARALVGADVRAVAGTLAGGGAEKMSGGRLNSLKPFIAVTRELLEILEEFLKPPEPKPEPEPSRPKAGVKPKKSKSDVMFELVRTK